MLTILFDAPFQNIKKLIFKRTPGNAKTLLNVTPKTVTASADDATTDAAASTVSTTLVTNATHAHID